MAFSQAEDKARKGLEGQPSAENIYFSVQTLKNLGAASMCACVCVCGVCVRVSMCGVCPCQYVWCVSVFYLFGDVQHSKAPSCP